MYAKLHVYLYLYTNSFSVFVRMASVPQLEVEEHIPPASQEETSIAKQALSVRFVKTLPRCVPSSL